MTRSLLLSLALVVAAGCSTGAQNTSNDLDGELTLVPAALSEDATIVENAMGQPALSTLVEAVVAAGLDDALDGPGPFTVFAPIDPAFEGMDLDAIDGQQLRDVLTYHVVPGSYTAADLSNGMTLETLNGADLTVSTLDAGDPDLKVDDADIVYADIVASNGRIHLINLVLNPTSGGGAQ